MRSVSVTEVPAGVQLIDVREPDEFAAGHAVGATNIPMSEFPSRVAEIDTESDIYVICQAGGRSAQVCEYLIARGLDPINIAGGTGAWITAGLPTE
ncbi:rhodanese-like domain-containing protein [Corynebacterium freiburgense]|uniref:rhodanese-like domain-containing protein n=1 Tax=Corynebacterium freiburgense TaxID=556548 RepID=UPI0003FC4BB8|nr:rhodanese-like domain-containing protein [Corynebacterium freiburgense]WJZ03698.1 Thiosulfate sulfurtransferase GlpE [Corynebacterium freiburgense]